MSLKNLVLFLSVVLTLEFLLALRQMEKQKHNYLRICDKHFLNIRTSCRLIKMRLGTSSHHTNPRSRTLVAWKNSMPIGEYRFVREQKRNQKNIPTT